MVQLQRLSVTPAQCMNDNTLILKPDQYHYLTRVLRLAAGAQFIAIPGTGTWWLAQLQSQAYEAKILDVLIPDTELPSPITLLAAPPKGQGFDDVVRITTELGVSRIVPLITQRTILQPSPQRIERWQRIAQEAAEQAHRLHIPEVTTPMPFLEALQWIQHAPNDNLLRYIGVVDPLAPHLLQLQPNDFHQGTILLVGPEGGWTSQEQEAAIAIGCQPFSLGRRVLRAVTAAIVVVDLWAANLEVHQNGCTVVPQRSAEP